MNVLSKGGKVVYVRGGGSIGKMPMLRLSHTTMMKGWYRTIWTMLLSGSVVSTIFSLIPQVNWLPINLALLFVCVSGKGITL